jgi:hypothetical protein
VKENGWKGKGEEKVRKEKLKEEDYRLETPRSYERAPRIQLFIAFSLKAVSSARRLP